MVRVPNAGKPVRGKAAGPSRPVRPRKASPLLATAGSLIADASASLVTIGSRFRHSFEVPVVAVSPDPEQPRRIFAEAEIAGLAATMAEQGQLQPILLRRDPAAAGRWIMVAGERRWRAARANGWPTLLAIEAGDDPEVVTLVENLQRVDLSPVEEARGLQRLIATKHWSQDRAAEALGKAKGEVSATLRILTLPADLLAAVLTSELALSRNALVELARLEGPVRQALLARACEEGLTVQAIRAASRPQLAEPSAAGERNLKLDGNLIEQAGGQWRSDSKLGHHFDDPASRQSDRKSGRQLDRRLLDAATDEIEAAIHDGVRLDAHACDSLERLRNSVEALLRAATKLTPEPAARLVRKAARRQGA